MKKYFLALFLLATSCSLYGMEEPEQQTESPNTQQSDTPTQPPAQEEREVNGDDVLRYFSNRLFHFFSVKGPNGLRPIAREELSRLWRDTKNVFSGMGNIISGIDDESSPFSNTKTWGDRFKSGIAACIKAPNVKAALIATGGVALLDFILTSLTTRQQEAMRARSLLQQASKNLKDGNSRSFVTKAIDDDQQSRVLPLLFYAFLATMGARLSDPHEPELTPENVGEIFVKLFIGCLAGSIIWNNLRRYVAGKGRGFLENIQKGLKFGFLSLVAGTSGYFVAKALK